MSPCFLLFFGARPTLKATKGKAYEAQMGITNPIGAGNSGRELHRRQSSNNHKFQVMRPLRGVAEHRRRGVTLCVVVECASFVAVPRLWRGAAKRSGFAEANSAERPRPPRLAAGGVEERLHRDAVSGATEAPAFSGGRRLGAALPRRSQRSDRGPRV